MYAKLMKNTFLPSCIHENKPKKLIEEIKKNDKPFHKNISIQYAWFLIISIQKKFLIFYLKLSKYITITNIKLYLRSQNEVELRLLSR